MNQEFKMSQTGEAKPEQVDEIAKLATKYPLTLEQSAEVYGMPIADALRHGGMHAYGLFFIDTDMRIQWAKQMYEEIEKLRQENAVEVKDED